ncbi:sensor histidine kinase [Planobispora siamensis]|uniref:histidine kinase n=1 Tax=Planobispora siamensis TaxID=936338 RepID=A0A8J3WJC6_9ACTN|nr:sensor histidine kinase [Planobispora siamensis]GIH89716.1 two-component sensor histidine kinase [Planobispora siamensis]
MDIKLGRAEERLASLGVGRPASLPLADAAVAAFLAVAACLELIAGGHSITTLPPAVLATAPLAIRRSQPWLAVALTFTGAVWLVLADVRMPSVAIAISGVLSFYTILRTLRRRAAWTLTAGVGALLAAAVAAVVYLWSYEYLREWGAVALALLGVIAATALLADVRRSRTEVEEVRADRLESLKEQAAMAERARIAREMHDIVAHSISMVAVQAETAPYTIPGLDERAKQEFADIATSARSTLTEMRRLLGVLRADIPDAPETAPQPGLARLPELIGQHDGEVDLDVVGEPVQPPQAVDVSAYRIVQEALTNVRVHAPGARVSIEVAYRPDMLVLRIADNGPGPSGDDSGGHGLVGMRERALALGGWFTAGPGPGGGFLIQTGLPLE